MRDCVDCGTKVLDVTGDVENFMVHDDVWTAAGMGQGFVCVTCLESRLGRPLTGLDFPLDLPINVPGMQRDTPRVYRLKSDAWAPVMGGDVSDYEDEVIERAEIDLEVSDIWDLLVEHGVEPSPVLVVALWSWKESRLRDEAAS